MSEQAAPVSCYIRTLNEERLLGRVVAAAREVVDEIVIVDSGSKDATVAIAQAAGARVIHQEWLGNGRQKRFAEDQCRNDFVLDLDADEVVSPALAAEIRALFAAGPPPLPIYELKLVTVPPVGKPWTNISVAYRRKLYDRRVVRAPDHKAWDQFEVPPGVEVGRLAGDLLHYSFRDLAQLVEKLNRVSTVRARDGKTVRARGRSCPGAVRLAVLFCEALSVSRSVSSRHLWHRARCHLRVRPLAARCQDVRTHSRRSRTVPTARLSQFRNDFSTVCDPRLQTDRWNGLGCCDPKPTRSSTHRDPVRR